MPCRLAEVKKTAAGCHAAQQPYVQRDVITRGVLTSTKDLDKKLMRYIRQDNKEAKPIMWKYSDPSRRITSSSSVSVD